MAAYSGELGRMQPVLVPLEARLILASLYLKTHAQLGEHRPIWKPQGRKGNLTDQRHLET